MPTPLDLVTDLPADFEVFGQAVDTSLADLKGGTSGQILAKNSNTDMDFVWIANDQGDITGITASSPLTGGGTSGAVTIGILNGTTSNLGAVQLSDSTSSTSTTLAATANAVKTSYDLANAAIPKSLIDAAGDLIVGTAADTAGRLGIGTANQVLKVNSGATALEWGTASSGYTLIRSGSFSGVSDTGTTFDSCFTTTYKNYVIVINVLGSSSGASTYFQGRNGSTTRSANYFGSVAFWNSGGTAQVTGTSGASQFTLGTHATAANSIYSMTISNIGTGASSIPVWSGTTMSLVSNAQGVFGGLVDNGAVNGFILSASAGTITGNAYVYGLAV